MASWKDTGEIEKLSSFEIPPYTVRLWISEIIKDLEKPNGPSFLFTLIERLGSTLTSPDARIRFRGVNFLSSLLAEMPVTILNPQQTHLIAQFYCDRIKDHHSVIPAVLGGIYSVSLQKNFESKSALTICHELFQQLPCQSQTNEDRLIYYRIINQFVNRFLKELTKIGPDFIYGLITIIQGERNPINLNYLFQILPDIFSKFKLGHLTEEVFDTVACFFPVDFNPSFTKTPSVTRESLAEGLAICLTANPEFAEFCYPLLIDKMSSTLRLAIVDSFYVLRISASKFPSEIFDSHFEDIWNYLRSSVFPGNDLELRDLASQTTTTLICNYPNSQLLGTVIETCRSPLSRVDLSLFQPAERLLTFVAKASPKACTKILVEFFPLLTKELEKYSSEPDRRSKILDTTAHFLEAAAFHKLSGPWPSIIPALVKESRNSDLAWRSLSLCSDIIGNEDRKTIYGAIKNRVGFSTDANQCLKSFAKNYPNEVLETLIKPMIDHIKEEDVFTEKYISGIVDLASEEPFSSFILPQMMETSISRNYGLSALQSLIILAGRPESFSAIKFLNLNCQAISRFVDHYQGWNFSDNNQSAAPLEIIQTTAKLLDLIVSVQSQEIQQQIAQEYSVKFMNNENQFPIIIFESILNSLPPTIIIPNISELIFKLISLALKTNENLICTCYCKLIATLINKYSDIDTSSILLKLQEIFNEVNNRTDNQINAVQILSWSTKGLLAKGSSEVNKWLDTMHSLLAQNNLANYAADGFQILMNDSPRCLSIENKCKIKLFYRQRAFEASFDRLKDAPPTSTSHLLALAYLMQGVSKAILISYFERLLIPMVRALDLIEQTEIVLPFLECLRGLLESSVPILETHLSTFIPRCLKLAKNSRKMSVRLISLECIALITKYPTTTLVPFRIEVLNELKPALDDPKRLVRRKAVAARSLWFLVGGVE